MEVCIIEQKAEIYTMKISLKLLLYDFYVVVVGEVESRKVKTELSSGLTYRLNRVAHGVNLHLGYSLY